MNLVFKALADPTRRKILELLQQRPMTAGELADQFSISRPTMSSHFAVLREAGLITSEKIGTTITYQISLTVLEDALLGFANVFGMSAAKKQRAPKAPAPKKINP